MNLIPGQGRSQEQFSGFTLTEDERRRLEADRKEAAEAQHRREAAERAEKAQQLQDKADGLLAMTPDEHRLAAARLMVLAGRSSSESAAYLRALAHLGLAQTDRSQP